MWVISAHRAFNVEKKLYTSSEGLTVGSNELVLIHAAEDVDDLFDKVKMVKDLALDTQETALMQAITFMSPSSMKEALKDVPKVACSQDKLAEALHYLVKKDRPDEPHRFLAMIRALSEVASLKLDSVSLQKFNEWSDIPLPQLLVDTWMSG